MELSLIRRLWIPFLERRRHRLSGYRAAHSAMPPRIWCVSFSITGCHFAYGFGKLLCAAGKPARIMLGSYRARPKTGKMPFTCSEGSFETGAGNDRGRADAAPSRSADAA